MKLDEWDLKAQLTLEHFRVAELELLMQKHPFMDICKTRGYEVDWHGLAQHYGIPTTLLDLTSNVEVAAFFACAQWENEKQRFTPADSGSGVMYRFDWSAFGPGYAKYFEPVGFGPGLRPARQHAWTFRLKPGVDFQTVPHVEAVEFRHAKAASAELFEMFANGDWLYPPDSLARTVEIVAKSSVFDNECNSPRIRTAQSDIDLIHDRLKLAQQHYKEHYERQN